MDVTILDRDMDHVVKSQSVDVWFWSGTYLGREYKVCLARSNNSWNITLNNESVWESIIYGNDAKFCDSKYFNDLLYIVIAKHRGVRYMALHQMFNGNYGHLMPLVSSTLGYYYIQPKDPIQVIATKEEFEDKSGWRVVLYSQNEWELWDDTVYVSKFFDGEFPEHWRDVLKQSKVVLYDTSDCDDDMEKCALCGKKAVSIDTLKTQFRFCKKCWNFVSDEIAKRVK